MSIQFGDAVGYVFVKSPDMHGGETFAGLERLRQEVVETDPEFIELLSGLDEVLAEPSLHKSICKKMRAQGKFLLGITSADNYRSHNTGTPYFDGLLYAEGRSITAEGRGDDFNDDSFSVVRLGTWISKARVAPSEIVKSKEALINSALSNTATTDMKWGVPVNRFTRIIDIHPSAEEPVEGYIFGQRKDESVIRALEFPDALTANLLATIDGWYSADIS